MIVVFVLSLVLGALTGLGTTQTEGMKVSANISGIPFLVISGLVFLLFALMELGTEKTPGKYITGTRTRMTGGRSLTLWGAVVRNLLRYVDFVGFGLVGLIVILATDQNQRVGDWLAGTVVVQN